MPSAAYIAPRLVLTSAPAEEPVTLAELKAWLKLDDDAQDDLLTSLLATARAVLEDITGRACVASQWTAYYDAWPRAGTYVGACAAREIALPKCPLLPGDELGVESVTYLDEDGTEQTLDAADYTVEAGVSPNRYGRLRLVAGAAIPSLGDFPGALRVTFHAGYGAAADVPAEIKSAIKQLAGHFHTNPVPVNTGNIVTEVPYTLKFLIEHLTVAPLEA